MTRLIRLSIVFALASLPFVSVVAAQQHPAMPARMPHEDHMAQMKKEAEMKQHGTPPGVATMQPLKAASTCTFEATEHGGVVRIAASSADARDAIHDFLRYQIKEHATGDPVSLQRQRKP